MDALKLVRLFYLACLDLVAAGPRFYQRPLPAEYYNCAGGPEVDTFDAGGVICSLSSGQALSVFFPVYMVDFLQSRGI
jgi:hypothetical protein